MILIQADNDALGGSMARLELKMDSGRFGDQVTQTRLKPARVKQNKKQGKLHRVGQEQPKDVLKITPGNTSMTPEMKLG